MTRPYFRNVFTLRRSFIRQYIGKFNAIERDREVICFESETPEGYVNVHFADEVAAVKAIVNIADGIEAGKRIIAIDADDGEVIY